MKYLRYDMEKLLRYTPYLFLLSFGLIFLAGCGKSNLLPGLVPAEGIVLYNNAPVEGATLTFYPEKSDLNGQNSTQPRPATSVSDSNGHFSVMTLEPKDGIFPGNYKVVITKNVPERVYTNEEMLEFFREKKPTPRPKSNNELPAQYSDLKTTSLNIVLGKKGDKAIKFELVD